MRYAALCIALLLVAPAVPGAAAAVDGAPAIGGPTPAADDAAGIADVSAPVATELRVALHEDRRAEWTVVVRYELADANETDAFRELAAAFEAGETGPSAEPFRNYAAGAAAATGREMNVTDVERTSPIDTEPDAESLSDPDAAAVGELRLSFVWTNFLATDGDRLVLGDAFLTPSESTWLRSLGPDQRLVLRTPEGYAVSSTPGVAVPIEDNAIVVEGPRTFADDERVRAVYEPVRVSTESPPWGLLAGAVVAAALILAGGLLLYRRMGDDDGAPAPAGAADPDDGGASARDPGPAADAGTAIENGGEEDLSLLSDEERVERLLERNGGRMRQADIVGETGWSDAKVSQLLSAMADEGRVEKLRLGRENLISLPDGDDGDEPA